MGGTLILPMARTIPRPIKSDSPGLRPGNSNVQPSLRTHDFIHPPPLPYLPLLPHHNTNPFLSPPFPWNCFVKGGYEFPSKKSLLGFSQRLSYLTFLWNVTLLTLLFSWNNLLFPFIALFSPDFSPISLVDASLPPLSHFSLIFPPFFFFASNVWVFWERAFLPQSVHCTSAHKLSTASLCWRPSDLSRWGFSLEHLASVLHVQQPIRNSSCFPSRFSNIIRWS